jgi:PTS system nitrogen regulatory IIA component
MKLVDALLKQFASPAPGDAPYVTLAPPTDPRRSATERGPDGDDDPPAVAGVSRWLFPQVVLLDCDVRDKREALDLAASTLERFHGVDAAPVARALWRRESAISTALGHGVAVPHARIGGISEPVTLLLRTRRPIPYGAADRKPVSQLFIILVPADGDPDEHLPLLANVATLFCQPAFRERIASASDTRRARRAFDEFAHAIDEAASAPEPPRVNGAARAS